MKFATFAALIASASALRLRQSRPSMFEAIQAQHNKCPTQAQFDEIAHWVHNELTTGDKTITADEAIAGAEAFAEKHGITITKEMEEEATKQWKKADKNGDN